MRLKTNFGQAFLRYKVHHILFWVIYFVFWLSFYQRVYPFNLVFINTVLYTVFNASAFYTIVYFLLPKFLNKQRYALFFLSTALALIIFSGMLATGLYLNMTGVPEMYKFNFGQAFVYGFMSTFSMVCMLGGAKLIRDKILSERQRLETELQYLKAQVNPHFLFNAINSVYFLIKKDPDKASETLIKLSDLLRFQLYDCSDEKIPVEKELEYIQNYIALEKIRKGDRVHVEYSSEGMMSGFLIAPFMLIPFLENAFKYVSNYPDFANTIRVKLLRTDSQLVVTFFNTHENLPRNTVGGIGLKNVKRRLELLYPDQYQLAIEEKPGTYSVTLSLKIA
ncbi:sensor histidine kinase [Ohtaekwangia koreensis]|nr:histidine kinase [Ohtaekwangia koreensis]